MLSCGVCAAWAFLKGNNERVGLPVCLGVEARVCGGEIAWVYPVLLSRGWTWGVASAGTQATPK